MDLDSKEVKQCVRKLKDNDFEPAYLALLTRKALNDIDVLIKHFPYSLLLTPCSLFFPSSFETPCLPRHNSCEAGSSRAKPAFLQRQERRRSRGISHTNKKSPFLARTSRIQHRESSIQHLFDIFILIFDFIFVILSPLTKIKHPRM